jgi:hypothetical protein
MPIITTCPDHPGVTMENVNDELSHAREHDGTAAAILAGFRSTYVPQAVAQGNIVRRTFGCRRCGTTVNTDDPNRPPYCTSCMGQVTV